MFAFVIDNKIINLSGQDISGSWKECADDAKVGDYFDKDVLTAQQKSEYIQAFIDSTAQSKDFADGVACASYATSTSEAWAAQALAFIAWRDNVWTYSYAEFAKMESGQRPVPSIDEFLTELPTIVWPN